MSRPSSASGGRTIGGVSSAVTAGPSRSNPVKGLNAAYAAGGASANAASEAGTNRYKYRGFNARIQTIAISFRTLLEPHEQSTEDQLAASRIEAAGMFAAADSHASQLATSEKFSSAELSSQDACATHSYFLAALQQFSQTNLYTHFLAFLAEVKGLVGSFPLLVRNQKRVVEVLLKHAAVPDSNAQKEIFTLMSVLARDLRGEFVVHFGIVMRSLLALLNPSDAANIQAIFQTLASLFKYTARQLAEKVDQVFEDYYTELVGHHKSYIRHFSAQSLAFLLRVAQRNGQSPDAAFKALLTYVPSRDNDAFKDGIAATLFETLKNISFQFQANHADHVQALLKPLRAQGLQGDFATDIILRLHRRMANYTRRQYAGPVWSLLIKRLQKLQDTLIAEPASATPTPQSLARATEATRVLQLLELWSSHRGGSRIPSIEIISRSLNFAFGPLFARRDATVEWKRTAAGMLTKYWKNQPANFEKLVAPHLDKLLALPITATEGKAAPTVDAIGVENATILLAFLEGAREQQDSSLPTLMKRLMPSIEALLLTSATTPELQTTARSLGLALLLELNGAHPVGSAYTIQPLEELQRSAPSAAARRLAKRRKQLESEQAGEEGEDEPTEEEPELDLDEDAAPEDDVEEEEVDSSSYTTPLPQTSLYACSAIMASRLRVSSKLQSYLVAQLVAALDGQHFTASGIAAATETGVTGSTLLLGASTLSQRISTLWTVLQLLPSSGVDVAAPISLYAQSSSASTKSLSVAEAVHLLITSLTALETPSTVFTASTPLDTSAAGEDSSPETNNHLLVAHQSLDQLIFLRAQATMTLSQMLKLRFARASRDDLGSPTGSNEFAASTLEFLPFLRLFLTGALETFRAAPAHVANVAALDRAFELAKTLQIAGVAEDDETDAPIAAPKTPAKKGKKAATAATAVVPATSAAELSTFLRVLFSSGSFTALSPFFMGNLSAAHGFLRSASLSVMRYFTPMRFAVEGTADVAKAADDADAMDTSSAPAAGNRSELVGECPMLSLMHDVSVLAPTLEFEKEFIRLLKKIEVLVNSRRVPDAYMRIVPSFLLGLLHLKLNPLWTHVQKILCSSFVNNYCLTVERQKWVWETIIRTKLAEIKARTQLLIKNDAEDEENEDEAKMDVDDEHVFDKHHARVATSAVAASAASSSVVVSSACVPTHSPLLLRFSHFVSMTSRSTDSFTYQTLLYACFALDNTGNNGNNHMSAVSNGFAQRLFNKTFIQSEVIDEFLGFVWQREFLVCFPNTQCIEEGMNENGQGIDAQAGDAEEAAGEEDLSFYERASSTSNLSVPSGFTLRSGARKLVKQKLMLFLKLFMACFHKAAKLPRTNELRNVLLTLLANNEEEVQRFALACLAKYQLPYLTPYLTTLQGLISEAKWRETMTGFPLAAEAGKVAPEHRTHFAAILIRILYPRLTQRQVGKASRAQGLSQRRAAVLGFLGGLSHEELQHLVSMVMGGSFRKIVNVVVRAAENKKATAVAASSSELTFEDILSNQIPTLSLTSSSRALEKALLDPRLYSATSSLLIPTAKQIGFLHMLQFFLSKLKSLSIPYLKFFVVQCSYMVLNAEIQIEKRKGQIAAQEEAEAAAAAAAAEAETKDDTADAKMDDEDEDVDQDDDEDEVDDEEEEEAEAEEEDSKEKTDSKKPVAAEEDDLVLPEMDDETEVVRSKTQKKKSTTPFALQKYLTELREIRQLAFSRMATILESYPHLFRPETSFKELAAPKGLQEEEKTIVYDGPSLAPYLQFFLAVSWPSLARLSTEGTQHMGGLWSCMLHLSSHHYLIGHFLKTDFTVLRVGWSDATNKKGLTLQLQSAQSALVAQPNQASSFPLFSLLLDSLGARSVHSTVVGAVLSVSESLLRARDDAVDWEHSKTEMAELEAERAEKAAQQVAHRKGKLQAKKKAAAQADSGVRAFADESSDDEEDEAERLITHRLVQIETLVLSPHSHATRARQYWHAHHAAQLRGIWELSVDKYLSQMHRWISHLSAVHKANNGRKDVATGSTPSTSGPKKVQRRSGGPRQTFFPRRELEVLSQIANFATVPQTAKKLVDLLLPFLHSPEKQHLLLNLHGRDQKKRGKHMSGARMERYKPAPTLHNTLLRILIALAPLLPGDDIEPVLETMQRLLFSLKGNTHRALLAELYSLLGGGDLAKTKRFAYLPLLARTVAALNALNAKRIEEYDDSRRLEVYAALDTAFGTQNIARQVMLLEQQREETMDETMVEAINAREAELRAESIELVRQAASSALPPSAECERVTPEMFTTLFDDFFAKSDDAHARALAVFRPLLHNLMHDLLDEDLGTRSSAASMLKKLLTFLSMPHSHAADESGLVELDTAPFVPLYGRLHTPHALVSGLLYPLVKRAIKHPVDKIRREVVLLLRELILTFPRFYRTFLLLVDPDSERDFLENIVSIQIHSRRRALTRLYQKVTVQDPADPNLFHAHASKAVDLQTIMHVILPLVHHFIYDPASSHNVSGSSGGAMAVMSAGAHSGTMSFSKQAQRQGQESTLLEEALKLASKLSAYMPWTSWFHQVQSYLKLMSAKPLLERTLVRLVCGFVREWHFEVEETAAERQLSREAEMRRVRDEKAASRQQEEERQARERTLRGEDGHYQEVEHEEPEAKMTDVTEVVPEPSALSQRIRSTLTKRLLPQLHSLLTGHKIKASKKSATKGMLTTYENQNELTSKSGMAGGAGSARDSTSLELVRVPVAMAMVALLRQLPQSIFHDEFPRLLTKLCIQLQHREQQARDLTRSTLLDILQLLGPYYFHFFVEELSRHLLNGYQVHVLGHMIWACLDTLVNKMKVAPGSIDHSLVKLMDLCMNDLLGEPAKQKEVAAIRAATKEARINHAADCFQMLAQVINFPGSIHYLVDPFRFKLAHDASLRLKELATIADALKRISVGLHANPSVQSRMPELLVYIHSYLFRNASESFAALFPAGPSGKLSKLDKKATASNKNRYRRLDLAPERTPMEALREENKARSEGRNVGGGLAQRKAMEFVLAMQSSDAGTSDFERTRAKAKPSKDETFLLVAATPARETFDTNSIAKGHHSNLILVFGLNLLYYTLKNRKLNTGSSVPPSQLPTQGSAAASAAAAGGVNARAPLSQEVQDNLARLDPFLHLIRDYCLTMGSELSKDNQAGTRSRVNKEGEKTTKTVTLATSSSAVIHVALKCSEHLLQMHNLPSLHAYLRDLCNYMFGLIHSKAAPNILSICFRNLSVILRVADWKVCGISAEKQRLMLHFIKQEVMGTQVTAATAIAFKLLQSILARTVELEELYDFIIVVSQLMVTSEVEEIQKQCSAAVYTFLYNYKLGAARMQTHFGFLLNQLNYPHATGRAAVLTLLQSIFTHFHPSVLEEQLEFLFLPLVVHMVNETNSANKKLSNSVLAVLLGKVSSTKQAEVMKMVYGWWESDESAGVVTKKQKKMGKLAPPTPVTGSPRSAQSQLLQFASLHIICIMIDLLKGQFTSQLYLHKSLAGLTSIMREKLAEQTAHEAEQEAKQEEVNADEQEDAADTSASWRVLYSTLLAMEKLFKHLPHAVLTTHLQQTHASFFEDLLACLLYPHAWVRTVAGRVVGFVLSAIPLASFTSANARSMLSSSLVGSPSALFQLMKASAVQLQSAHLSEALAEQVVKNLVWISVAAHNIGAGDIWERLDGEDADDEQKDEEEQEEAAPEEEEQEEDADVEMKDGNDEAAPVAASAPVVKVSAQKFAKSDNRILNWLFTRLSYMCKRDDGIRMRESIFRYFATMSSQLPVAVFSCFLLQVLYPLYRLSAGTVRAEEVELQSFAGSVQELIQTRVGTPVFLAAYNSIRARVQSVRQARKTKTKQLSVMRPDVAANRKQAKHDLKRVAKKRKIKELKLGRKAHAPAAVNLDFGDAPQAKRPKL